MASAGMYLLALLAAFLAVSDSVSWNEVGGGGPGARLFASFTNVEDHGSLLFAGWDNEGNSAGYGGISFSDVWQFAASGWSLLATSGPMPESRYGHAAASFGKELLVHGGHHDAGRRRRGATITPLKDMWRFTPATRMWAQVTFSTRDELNPTSRYGHSMEAAPDQSAIFMFGGYLEGDCHQVSNALWSLNLTSLAWQQMHPSTGSPVERRHHASAVSKRRNLMFIFGGRQYDGGCNDNWFLNDLWSYAFAANTWSQLSASNAPPALNQAGMAYSEIEDQLIIYGGYLASNQHSGVLYQFDVAHGQWSTLHDGTFDAPPARRSPQAVWRAPGTLVMCCGMDGDGNELSDTWKAELPRRSLCVAGHVFNGTDCSECPAGTYDANPETDLDDCVACEEDTYSDAGMKSCAPLLGPWIQALPPPDLTIVRNLAGGIQLSVTSALLPSHFHGIAMVPRYFMDLAPTPDSLQPGTLCSSQWHRSVYNNQDQLVAELTYADFDDKCLLNETQSGELIQRSGYAALFVVMVGANDSTVAKMVMPVQLNFTRTATGVNTGYVATGSHQINEKTFLLGPFHSSVHFYDAAYETKNDPAVYVYGSVAYVEHELEGELEMDVVQVWISSSKDSSNMTALTENLTESFVVSSSELGKARFSFPVNAQPGCSLCFLHVLSRVSQASGRRLAVKDGPYHALEFKAVEIRSPDDGQPFIFSVEVSLLIASLAMVVVFGLILRLKHCIDAKPSKNFLGIEFFDCVLDIGGWAAAYITGDLDFTNDGGFVKNILLASTVLSVVVFLLECVLHYCCKCQLSKQWLWTLEAAHFAGEDIFQGTYYLLATLSELQGEHVGWSIVVALTQSGFGILAKLSYETYQARQACRPKPKDTSQDPACETPELDNRT